MKGEQQFIEIKENINPLDLLRYPSIRTVTIGFLVFNIFSEMT